jgi:hypothetical protein
MFWHHFSFYLPWAEAALATACAKFLNLAPPLWRCFGMPFMPKLVARPVPFSFF